MTPEVRKALEEAAAKYERGAKGSPIDIGARTCPLCIMFLSNKCKGCPVAEAADAPFCECTPYEYVWLWANSETQSQFRTACAEEAKFLRSLIPQSAPEGGMTP